MEFEQLVKDFENLHKPITYLTDKTIVLNLDSTLVNISTLSQHTAERELLDSIPEISHRIISRDVDIHDTDKDGKSIAINKYSYFGIKRPHLKEFLLACRRIFKYIIIWCAGHEDYVNSLVDEIFRDLPFRPDLVYTAKQTLFDIDRGTIKSPVTLITKSVHMNLSMEKLLYIDHQDCSGKTLVVPRYEFELTKENILKDDDVLYKVLEKLLVLDIVNNDISKSDLIW